MLELTLNARAADLGHGLTVRRVLPLARRRMVGPFVFLDHAGPVTIAPEDIAQADVRPHPHIGLSTVSYLLSGQITHRDSLGMQQDIRPGDVNWMTAGRGISHSERFTHPAVVRRWRAGADADVGGPARGRRRNRTRLHPLPQADAAGARAGWRVARVIAGQAYGQQSPVRTHSPLFYVHAECQAGAQLPLPGGHSEQAVYVAKGSIEHAGETYEPGQLLVFDDDSAAKVQAQTAATLMVFGGEPLGERHMFWNFVSSRKERIEQAKADWAAGRFPLPPDDDQEWIPLPG